MENFNFTERPKTKGRKPQLFLVLDTETATLPFANELAKSAKQKQTIAIAKPLVYDIGWQILDRAGNIYSRHNYLVSEIFSVPSVFNTAYYKEKKPIYLEMLKNGKISLLDWNSIMEILLQDLEKADFVGAFNSMFDFKKAIPFTEKYIQKLYSNDYYDWEKYQKQRCVEILSIKSNYQNPNWDSENFNFRGVDYPLFDLWGIACERLINTKAYKSKCLEMSMITSSGQFFKTSAETTFRHIMESYGFIESHTALDDAIIESEILQKAAKKGKLTMGLQYFPFQMLGKTTDFIFQSKSKISYDEVQNVINVMVEKANEYDKNSTFLIYLERDIMRLQNYQLENYEKTNMDLFNRLTVNELQRKIAKKRKQLLNLKEFGNAWVRTKNEIQDLEEELANI